MVENVKAGGTAYARTPPSGEFAIRKIYVKDISFETPVSPGIFMVEWAPDADVNLRTSAAQMEPGDFEVTLTITATVKVGEHTAFLAEVQQAGIFRIVGVTEEELKAVVGVYCPSILYPYAREVVSDLVVRGGFPPFLLSPVNFDALYEQQHAGEGAGASEEIPAATPTTD
jgi:preprotein translocase subunit SecB